MIADRKIILQGIGIELVSEKPHGIRSRTFPHHPVIDELNPGKKTERKIFLFRKFLK